MDDPFETRRAQLRKRLHEVHSLEPDEARKELADIGLETLRLIYDQYQEPDSWEKASMRFAADHLSALLWQGHPALAGTELQRALVPRELRGAPPSSHSEEVATHFGHVGIQAELKAIRDNP